MGSPVGSYEMKKGFFLGLLGLPGLIAGLFVLGAERDIAVAQEPQPAQRFDLRNVPLSAPYLTPSAVNGPRHLRRPQGVRPRAPKGFRVNLFAEGLATPRTMAVAGNGDIFVVESSRGRISVLRDTDQDGFADQKETFASGLRQPYGLAVRDPYLYVADLRAVWRYPYRAGAGTGSAPAGS